MSNAEKQFPVTRERLLEIAKQKSETCRDKTLLAEKGIDEEYFTQFTADIKTAEGFKSDKEIAKDSAALTRSKDKKLQECYAWVREAKFHIERTFKAKSGETKEFPADYLKARSNESLMILLIPNVVNLLEKYKEQLTAKKMPADFIAKGTTLKDELNTLNNEQEKMKEDNRKYTSNRNYALEVVYDKVNEINKAGRLAYKDDPAMLKFFDSPWPVNTKKPEPATEENKAEQTA